MNNTATARKNKPNRNRNNSSRQRSNKGNRFESKLDHNLFIKSAQKVEQKSFISDRKIIDLPVRQELIQSLQNKGFEFLTEIQDKTIEPLLEGRDLVGVAQTGTGKTAAFLVPIIQQLLLNKTAFQKALIIVPTRELAIQVNDEFKELTKGLKLYSTCYIGGTNINTDLKKVRRPGHVVIGTPGRLKDLYERNALRFSAFDTLILDEFDRMLDMGFARDLDAIIDKMTQREQTMLFSATLDKNQKKRIDALLNDPIRVKVSEGDKSNDNVEQDIVKIDKNQDRFKVLCDVLQEENCNKVIIFDETKHRVKKLCKKLESLGIRSEQLQGNMSQSARVKALNAFRTGRSKVLVATDVAARGIDIDDISHVINYNPPMTYDSYIHRIGRTGRAGRTGVALTFVD